MRLYLRCRNKNQHRDLPTLDNVFHNADMVCSCKLRQYGRPFHRLCRLSLICKRQLYVQFSRTSCIWFATLRVELFAFLVGFLPFERFGFGIVETLICSMVTLVAEFARDCLFSNTSII